MCRIWDMHALQGRKFNVGHIIFVASTRDGHLLKTRAEGRQLGNIGRIARMAPWRGVSRFSSSAVGAYPTLYLLQTATHKHQFSACDDDSISLLDLLAVLLNLSEYQVVFCWILLLDFTVPPFGLFDISGDKVLVFGR